jgi:hypothetical protein
VCDQAEILTQSHCLSWYIPHTQLAEIMRKSAKQQTKKKKANSNKEELNGRK